MPFIFDQITNLLQSISKFTHIVVFSVLFCKLPLQNNSFCCLQCDDRLEMGCLSFITLW